MRVPRRRYPETNMPFASIPEAIEEIRAGRVLVVVDDEDRENEGDLTIAAEKIKDVTDQTDRVRILERFYAEERKKDKPVPIGRRHGPKRKFGF